MHSPATPPRTGWLSTLFLFGGAALLAAGVTQILLPALAQRSSAEPVLLWFAAAGFVLFPALLIVGWLLLRLEGLTLSHAIWRDRLRFRPMNRNDWLWSGGAFAAIAALSGAIIGLLLALRPDAQLAPWFLDMEPLEGGRLWILAAWLPLFALTIFTEEVVWRGIVLPRQETALGGRAWFANGCGWLLFHAAFGPTILLSLLPIVLILPWVVQRRRNSSIGVIVHAAFNGPGFLAVALGWV